MGISKEKEGFESREANRQQDTEKEGKQESESRASSRNNNEQFFKKRVEMVQFFLRPIFINLCPSLVFSNLPHSFQSFITLTPALSPQSGGLQRIRVEANEGESAEKVKNKKEGLRKNSWGWRKC